MEEAMRVEDFLRDTARRFGAKIAVVDGRKRIGFAELDRMSDRLALSLINGGIAAGDCVATFMGTTWERVVVAFAILKAGAIVVPVSPSTTSAELGMVLNQGCVAGIVTEARLALKAAAAIAETRSVGLIVLCGGAGSPKVRGCIRFEDAISGVGPVELPPVASRSDAAMMAYLSDRSGNSTSMVTNHAEIAEMARAATTETNNAGSFVVGTAPVSFLGALCQALIGGGEMATAIRGAGDESLVA